MYNPEEITSFCSKSCNLRPSSNLFTNVMQNQGRIYRMAQCQGPHAQMVRLFLVFTNIWQEDVAKIPKVQGPQHAM